MTDERIDRLRKKALSLPLVPGVYFMKDKTGDIIYIGKAKKLKNRVVSYFRGIGNHLPKVEKMVSNVDDFDYMVCTTEFEALLLECSQIKMYKPKYNILLKDDKGYKYIKVTAEPYPRLIPVMRKDADNARYIGPYLSSYAINTAVEDVQRIFRLPVCTKVFPRDMKKTRPCLNYHIKRCMGLCRGDISEKEYGDIVDEAVEYLTGGNKSDVKSLRAEMEQCAEKLDFERAAKLRDRITAIQKVNENQKVILSDRLYCDAVSVITVGTDSAICQIKVRAGKITDKVSYIFYGEDSETVLCEFLPRYYSDCLEFPKKIYVSMRFEGMEALSQLVQERAGKKIPVLSPSGGEGTDILKLARENALELLSQKKTRKHSELAGVSSLCRLLNIEKAGYIESYDISNLGSDTIVSGMVVFVDGRADKSRYKRFTVRDMANVSDTDSMAQVLSRRFARYLSDEETDEGFKTLPDLILLDGGRGQLSAVKSVMAALDISVPVFGMVKNRKHKTRTLVGDSGELALYTSRDAFTLVSNIQEEVHRFSVSFERKAHSNKTFALDLTKAPGVGKSRAEKILKAYKTKKALLSASSAELKEKCGLPEDVAKSLFDFLHDGK